jgi:hypothetical protein
MGKQKGIDFSKLSRADKILISLHKASNGTTERIPFEDIVLQSWKDFPSDFCLPNHPEFPDSSVIAKRLYSDLITKRLVISLRNNVYRLSDKGLLSSNEILGLAQPDQNEEKDFKAQLSRDEKQFLDSALRSKTFSAWKKSGDDSLIDYDVRVFFQFSTKTSINERKRRVETAKDSINKALTLKIPEAKDLEILLNFLVQKFPQLFQEN